MWLWFLANNGIGFLVAIVQGKARIGHGLGSISPWELVLLAVFLLCPVYTLSKDALLRRRAHKLRAKAFPDHGELRTSYAGTMIFCVLTLTLFSVDSLLGKMPEASQVALFLLYLVAVLLLLFYWRTFRCSQCGKRYRSKKGLSECKRCSVPFTDRLPTNESESSEEGK